MSKILGLIIIDEYAGKQVRTVLANEKEDNTTITKRSTKEEIAQKVIQSYTI